MKKEPKKEPKVINIMADGSICDDLSTYLARSGAKLPDLACRLIAEFIRDGSEILQKRQAETDHAAAEEVRT